MRSDVVKDSNNSRNAMNQEQFDEKFGYTPPPHGQLKSHIRKSVRKCFEPCTSFQSFWHFIVGFLPILRWLPEYDWKTELINDTIGGFTVGILLVPQGVAYSLLVGVEPVYGLYSSFFPALVYMFLGTSKHCSIGPSSVVSLMAGVAINQFLPHGDVGSSRDSFMSHNSTGNSSFTTEQLTPIEVASTLTLTIGIVQLVMAVLRLDFLTTYLSDQVVSGFTTAVAFLVIVAQLDDLFGLDTPERNGIGYIFFKFYFILMELQNINIAAVIISAISIAFLIVSKDYVSPIVEKKIRVPIPSELIAVVFGTIISYLTNLNSLYKVEIVDEIPAGMPMPVVPRLDLIPALLSHSVGIAIVIIAIQVSLAKLFAKKNGYEIDAGQELFAIGFSEVVCSFFNVYPISTALARSTVNEGAGSKSLFSSAFSCVMLLVIILWVGPLLEALPMCVLASIIVVSLKGMIMKLRDLKILWPLSKIDFMIWLVSFVATICCDVMLGLAISIIFALLTAIFRLQWPRWNSLKRLTETTIYREEERYSVVSDEYGIRIFRFDAPLLFCNAERFKITAFKSATNDVAESEKKTGASNIANGNGNQHFKQDSTKARSEKSTEIKHLIVDCSGFTFVDYSGSNAIKEVFDGMKKRGVNVSFAAAKANVREFFETSGFYKSVAKSNFYPTISDAVLVAQNGTISNRSENTAKIATDTDSSSSNICRIFVDPVEA